MEWFGLTSYGFDSPLKDMIRSDYKEPTTPSTLEELIEQNPNKMFHEVVKQVDCYIVRADGFAYKSIDRMQRIHTKGIFKPVGPAEQYKYPGTMNMNYGFFLSDPSLKGQKWFIPQPKRNAFTTDVTQYVEFALKIDKFFKL